MLLGEHERRSESEAVVTRGPTLNSFEKEDNKIQEIRQKYKNHYNIYRNSSYD